ncbi:Ribosomal large subunit pseudouridine synthase C [compost metagenome]
MHAKHAGHSIAGDSKYGDEEFTREIRELGGKRLFLHAHALRVTLPDGSVLALEAPVDEMWAKTLGRLDA